MTIAKNSKLKIEISSGTIALDQPKYLATEAIVTKNSPPLKQIIMFLAVLAEKYRNELRTPMKARKPNAMERRLPCEPTGEAVRRK
jgi:hypothetical protein